MIASADRSMSASVVAQLETEMRMAAMPCHVVPPAQHVPSSWTAAMTARVRSSLSSKRTSTWLSTTSLRIAISSAPRRSAMRRASAQQRSTRSATPSRPSERSAA